MYECFYSHPLSIVNTQTIYYLVIKIQKKFIFQIPVLNCVYFGMNVYAMFFEAYIVLHFVLKYHSDDKL